VGLTTAILLRQPVGRALEDPSHLTAKPPSVPSKVEPESAAPTFRVVGQPSEFSTLAAAVAAASNGSTIAIDGDGSVSMAPVNITGKSLVLKATEGCRPRLQLTRPSDGQPWQPLIASDRPLTLMGLEFAHQSEAATAEVSHLVYVENSDLRLEKCRFLAPHGSAAVVCRGSGRVELEDCQLSAAAMALCVEYKQSRDIEVVLRRNVVEVATPGSAALSLWASESGRAGIIHLRLEGNTIRAGRPISFGALPRRVEIAAQNNRFVFRDALLSYANSPEPWSWRRITSWQGQQNTYEGGAHWLSINGAPSCSGDWQTWRDLWEGGERGALPEVQNPNVAQTVKAE